MFLKNIKIEKMPSCATARPSLAADELKILLGSGRTAVDTAARRSLSFLPWRLVTTLLRVADGGQPQHAGARCHLPPPEPDAEIGLLCLACSSAGLLPGDRHLRANVVAAHAATVHNCSYELCRLRI